MTQVEISDRAVRRIKSPIFWIVVPLTGVAASFCPLGLFMMGRHGWSLFNPLVLLIFAVIWGVLVYYASIANEVAAQIRDPAISPEKHSVDQ